MGAVTVIGAAAVQNESRPAWMGAVIRGGQHVADALGIPAHLTTMDPDTAFGVIAMPVLLALVLLGVQAGAIARAVTSREFWDDTGRLLGVAQLLLLVLAYAFGAGGRSRSFGAAVGDILSGQLPDLLPMAVATQWLLLSVLWLVVGASAGVRRSDLTAPFDAVRGMALIAVFVVAFTAAWMAPPSGVGPAGRLPAVVAVGAVLLMFGYLSAVSRGHEQRPDIAHRRREALEHSFRRPGDPPGRGPENRPEEALIAALLARGQDRPERPTGSIWLPAPALVLRLCLLWAALLGVPAAVVTWIFSTGHFPPPDLPGVLRVELVVLSVMVLMMVFSFRRNLDGRIRVSPAVPRLIDLSLLLSVGWLGLSGALSSPVTLGPLPAWVVALGPPLVIAALVLVLGVLLHRRQTPRLPLALTVAVAAGPLVLPLRSALEHLLGGIVHALG
ncbi:hypothetical protein [Streptomyces sp. NRRL S-495]|uniref:hypothetical protein n=1 Tax=Streptomyces sp. NRRL S-495 TaxID=1609133 RepID=UPI0005F8A74C|nr:hypothetical protein [Streptomyces sp. NRRL S-495]KJY25228.1 hypothetical protein VR45_39695 [Streptomyces sp. NRRL S-495]